MERPLQLLKVIANPGDHDYFVGILWNFLKFIFEKLRVNLIWLVISSWLTPVCLFFVYYFMNYFQI